MVDINASLKEGYNHAVLLNLQQKGSRLYDSVRNEVQTTKRYFYDSIGNAEANDVVAKHLDTPVMNSKTSRRLVHLVTSDWGDLIDREEQLQFLSDPTSAYALNAAYALGRRKDMHIIEAALGDAYEGEKGEVIKTFNSNKVIASNYNDDNSKTDTGLTIDKLRLARLKLDDANVDDDEEQFCVLTAKQMSDLLKSTQITSIEYNSVRALVSGTINTFMGFTFKRVSSNLLPKNTDYRTILCYSKSAIILATDGDIKTEISLRNDKRFATQVYASLNAGATRMSEDKVIKILCKE